MKKSQYQNIIPCIQIVFFFFVSSLWDEMEKHTNTDNAVTGWMLGVIPHIRKDVFKHSQNEYCYQNVFAVSTEKELR